MGKPKPTPKLDEWETRKAGEPDSISGLADPQARRILALRTRDLTRTRKKPILAQKHYKAEVIVKKAHCMR